MTTASTKGLTAHQRDILRHVTRIEDAAKAVRDTLNKERLRYLDGRERHDERDLNCQVALELGDIKDNVADAIDLVTKWGLHIDDQRKATAATAKVEGISPDDAKGFAKAARDFKRSERVED